MVASSGPGTGLGIGLGLGLGLGLETGSVWVGLHGLLRVTSGMLLGMGGTEAGARGPGAVGVSRAMVALMALSQSSRAAGLGATSTKARWPCPFHAAVT